MDILVTAFDPFGGERVNPAQEAVALLPETLGGHTIHKLVIPTVFGTAGERVMEAMDRLKPDAVISVGQAGGRKAVCVERVAVNLMDARIQDNAGNQPVDRPVAENGPTAYFSTLPVKAMAQAVKDAGLEGAVSYTAGTFVCNSVLYTALRHAAEHMPATRCAFIHVPYIPEQVVGKENVPAMPLEDIVRALTAAIGAIQ